MGCPTPIGPRPHFIPTPFGAQVVMRYLLEDEPVENVYHVSGTAEWTPTTLGALGVAFENWENTTGKALRGDATELIEVSAVALVAQDGPIVVSAVAIVGTVHSGLLPNNVTLAVKWTTAHRGRSFRGRTYHIGLTIADRAASGTNFIDATRATAIVNGYTALLTTALPNSGQMVVLSYAHDCTWRANGLMTTITGVGITDPIFDSQRRRLPGHNVHH